MEPEASKASNSEHKSLVSDSDSHFMQCPSDGDEEESNVSLWWKDNFDSDSDSDSMEFKGF